jgi:anti-sigma factor RsiW
MALDDDTLQRYFDGELSPVEERTVRGQVEGDAAAQARLRELAKLSELVRIAVAQSTAGLDADALFAGIQSDVRKQEQLGFGERFKLHSSEWVQHKKGVLIPTIASLAVAAAALVVLLVPHETSEKLATVPVPASQTAPGVQTVHGSRVENVDFGKSTGTVFEVDNEGVSAAVVWIADDEEESP